MTVLIISALSLGFLGSFHCVGMCGPLVLSLPLVSSNKFSQATALTLYHFGRSLTYAILGVVFGGIGQGMYLLPAQRFISLGFGVLIIIYLFFYTFQKKKNILSVFVNSLMQNVKQKLSVYFKRKGVLNMLSIGMLNGLLPCGLVYVALAAATVSAGFLHGGIFMFLFGVGTLPLMLTVSLIGASLNLKFRLRLQKAAPIVWSLMAVLLILRGLNLNIPYISPGDVSPTTSEAPTGNISCHK